PGPSAPRIAIDSPLQAPHSIQSRVRIEYSKLPNPVATDNSVGTRPGGDRRNLWAGATMWANANHTEPAERGTQHRYGPISLWGRAVESLVSTSPHRNSCGASWDHVRPLQCSSPIGREERQAAPSFLAGRCPGLCEDAT